jgi:hypothetical protein
MVERFNQGQFTVNVCTRIIGNYIISPILFSISIISATHLQFLCLHLLIDLQKIIPRQSLHFIYFMHDSTSPYHGRSVRKFLNEKFKSPWIQ